MSRFLNFLRKLRNRLFGVEELKSELAVERKARVRATNLLHRAILENRRAIGAQHFGSPEADGDPNGLATAEKQIYSQFGEDGIIDHLIRHLPGIPPLFIELGTENYREANTRFLAVHRYWSGLIVEADARFVAMMRADGIPWKHGLRVIESWISASNVNELLGMAPTREGEVGLLSLDIDGVDYWIWKAIDRISPWIVILEYRGDLGPGVVWTVPYDENFARSPNQYQNLYYGASLRALSELSARKGYRLVGVNRAGGNAFFVRSDILGSLIAREVSEVFRPSCFYEGRSDMGSPPAFTGRRERLQGLEGSVWHNLATGDDFVFGPEDVERCLVDLEDQS